MLHGHYTTANALINIIKNEFLWATNIKFLNDEQEFLHAIDLAKEIIKESSKNAGKITQSLSKSYNEFIISVSTELDNLDRYHAESIFTCSFSEEKDLLSQWRGYCPSNQGYCIHLDLNGLLDAAKKKFKNCEIYPCVYDDLEKKFNISAALNRCWKEYIRIVDDGRRKQSISNLALEIARLASYFKHPSFAEEKESRLVIGLAWETEEHIKFRVGPMSIIPYLEIPTPKSLIKKIGIGPARDQSLVKRGLSSLVDSQFGPFAAFGDFEINESKIPYRL